MMAERGVKSSGGRGNMRTVVSSPWLWSMAIGCKGEGRQRMATAATAAIVEEGRQRVATAVIVAVRGVQRARSIPTVWHQTIGRSTHVSSALSYARIGFPDDMHRGCHKGSDSDHSSSRGGEVWPTLHLLEDVLSRFDYPHNKLAIKKLLVDVSEEIWALRDSMSYYAYAHVHKAP
jgi:hypothetical protein